MSSRFAIAVIISSALGVRGQTLMEGPAPGEPPSLFSSDAAILETPEARKDLGCSVTPLPAKLGFDLAYHAGYEATVPVQDLSQSGSVLTVIFRVTPIGEPAGPTYFSQKWVVPAMDENARGAGFLHGELVLGAGKYQVDWLVRDRAERFCSAYWRISTESHGKHKAAEMNIKPGTVRPEVADLFADEAPVKRDTTRPLHVLVLVHIAPRAAGAATMPPDEMQALVSMLHRVGREPRIGSYSVTAFNAEQGEVLYRSERVSQIDFAALGAAVKQLRLGSIDVRKLRNSGGEAQFLAGLVQEGIAAAEPDAVIFIGVKNRAEPAAVRSSLRDIAEPRQPVVYLTYNADPIGDPWRDAIGAMVKFWKGFEFTIARPLDLALAWNEVMSRIAPKATVDDALMDEGAIDSVFPKK